MICTTSRTTVPALHNITLLNAEHTWQIENLSNIFDYDPNIKRQLKSTSDFLNGWKISFSATLRCEQPITKRAKQIYGNDNREHPSVAFDFHDIQYPPEMKHYIDDQGLDFSIVVNCFDNNQSEWSDGYRIFSFKMQGSQFAAPRLMSSEWIIFDDVKSIGRLLTVLIRIQVTGKNVVDFNEVSSITAAVEMPLQVNGSPLSPSTAEHLQALISMFDNGDQSDARITLLGGGGGSSASQSCASLDETTTFRVHRNILVASCPMFKDSFSANAEGDTSLELMHHDPVLFGVFLRFLYGGEHGIASDTRSNWKQLVALLELADEFRVDRLATHCIDWLAPLTTPENFLVLFNETLQEPRSRGTHMRLWSDRLWHSFRTWPDTQQKNSLHRKHLHL